MVQTSKLIPATAVAAVLGLGAFGWYQTHPELWPQFEEGQELIAQIENFRQANGRLPSEREIGPTDESGPVYYQSTGSNSYQVWFGRELGESYRYDSTRGSWR